MGLKMLAATSAIAGVAAGGSFINAVSQQTGIPVRALQAYAAAQASPLNTCGADWQGIATVGQLESGHGTHNRQHLNEAGVSVDASGRSARITSGAGAIGPMQFMPATWDQYSQLFNLDGDGDGVENPDDIDDAALGTVAYLCRNGWGPSPEARENAWGAYNGGSSWRQWAESRNYVAAGEAYYGQLPGADIGPAAERVLALGDSILVGADKCGEVPANVTLDAVGGRRFELGQLEQADPAQFDRLVIAEGTNDGLTTDIVSQAYALLKAKGWDLSRVWWMTVTRSYVRHADGTVTDEPDNANVAIRTMAARYDSNVAEWQHVPTEGDLADDVHVTCQGAAKLRTLLFPQRTAAPQPAQLLSAGKHHRRTLGDTMEAGWEALWDVVDAGGKQYSAMPGVDGLGRGLTFAAQFAAPLTLQATDPTVPVDPSMVALGTAGVSGMVQVDGFTVSPVIANNVRALIAAAKADGITVEPGSANGGFRTLAAQEDIRARHCTDVYDPNASCDIPVAVPGTSNHEQGLAIDVNLAKDPRLLSWMRANAPRFGLYNNMPVGYDDVHYSTNGH